MHTLSGESWLTTAEAAQLIGLQPVTLRQHVARGRERIPSVKVAGVRLYRATDVDAYLRTHRRVA